MKGNFAVYTWGGVPGNIENHYRLCVREGINKASYLDLSRYKHWQNEATVEIYTHKPLLQTIIDTCGKTTSSPEYFRYEYYAVLELMHKFRKNLKKQMSPLERFMSRSEEHVLNPPRLLGYLSYSYDRREYLVMQIINNDKTMSKLTLFTDYQNPLYMNLKYYPEDLINCHAFTRDILKKNEFPEMTPKEFLQAIDGALRVLSDFYNESGIKG